MNLEAEMKEGVLEWRPKEKHRNGTEERETEAVLSESLGWKERT